MVIVTRYISSVFFSNMTEACAQIHNESLTALRGPNPPDYVATFGNTIPENASDWVLMDIGNPPAAVSWNNTNSKICLQGTLWWEGTPYTVKPVFKGHSDERAPSIQ